MKISYISQITYLCSKVIVNIYVIYAYFTYLLYVVYLCINMIFLLKNLVSKGNKYLFITYFKVDILRVNPFKTLKI